MLNIGNDKIEPLLRKIIDKRESSEGGSAGLSQHLAKELIAIGHITSDLKRIRILEDEAKSDHAKIMTQLGAQRGEIQGGCLHYETTYYGDAAGGSDSHTSCDICGLELS